MPSSTRASGRFLAVGQSGQTGKRTVSAHPYFKVRRRQGRKQLEKGRRKETKKGTRLALSKRSQLALFCCSVPKAGIWRPGNRRLARGRCPPGHCRDNRNDAGRRYS